MRFPLKVLPCLLAVLACSCGRKDAVDMVDPSIGGVSALLQPTRPLAHLPNSMIRWTPARVDLSDDTVEDFPLTLTSHRLHSVFGMLPLAGVENWRDAVQAWDCEKCTPYSYSVRLEGCRLLFSPSSHSGMVSLVFDSPDGGYIRFRSRNEEGAYALDGRILRAKEKFAGHFAYLYLEFASDVALCERDESGAVLIKSSGSELTFRYAVSYMDSDSAGKTLSREIRCWDVGKVGSSARKIWKEALGKIEVEGGSESLRRLFYTSFYRCYERMVETGENGRYYSPFDRSVHEYDRPYYSDNWIWDTHVALEPLMTILDPRKEEDKIASYLEMYRICGYMPSFAVAFGDWAAMTGNYAAVWMADALAKGLDFDVRTAFEACRHNSLEETLLPWRNGSKCELDDFYNENGWYPALHPGESETVGKVGKWEGRQALSLSTAFSYCDWAVSRLAASLGRTEDAVLFGERAGNWRKIYRADKGMFWPRDAEGRWIEGLDPRYMDRNYCTENNAYTFQWDVKHDLPGLFAMMGGKASAERKLDSLFHIWNDIPKFRFLYNLPDATGMTGQFAIGNEPGFHIPYLYDYLGSPWKTQKRVRQVMETFFSDSVMGLPGDEDGGGMSAFVVFSMMGFFPVTPGIPVYAIGTPFFRRTCISLPDGKKFEIRAPGVSRDNKYIRSAKLNGRVLDEPFLSHEELMSGGTLVLEMGSEPNKEWGSVGVKCGEHMLPD